MGVFKNILPKIRDRMITHPDFGTRFQSETVYIVDVPGAIEPQQQLYAEVSIVSSSYVERTLVRGVVRVSVFLRIQIDRIGRLDQALAEDTNSLLEILSIVENNLNNTYLEAAIDEGLLLEAQSIQEGGAIQTEQHVRGFRDFSFGCLLSGMPFQATTTGGGGIDRGGP